MRSGRSVITDNASVLFTQLRGRRRHAFGRYQARVRKADGASRRNTRSSIGYRLISVRSSAPTGQPPAPSTEMSTAGRTAVQKWQPFPVLLNRLSPAAALDSFASALRRGSVIAQHEYADACRWRLHAGHDIATRESVSRAISQADRRPVLLVRDAGNVGVVPR